MVAANAAQRRGRLDPNSRIPRHGERPRAWKRRQFPHDYLFGLCSWALQGPFMPRVAYARAEESRAQSSSRASPIPPAFHASNRVRLRMARVENFPGWTLFLKRGGLQRVAARTQDAESKALDAMSAGSGRWGRGIGLQEICHRTPDGRVARIRSLNDVLNHLAALHTRGRRSAHYEHQDRRTSSICVVDAEAPPDDDSGRTTIAQGGVLRP
jgi:hypothetical protein